MKEDQYRIEWPQSMQTGVDCIDEQHQMLASMIRSAERRLADDNSRNEIEAVVLELMTYALYHFDTEEELMLVHDYPSAEREKHCQEHRRFSATIAEYQQNLRLGIRVTSDELFGFIKDWLNNHILCSDKRLGEFLSQILAPNHD